MWRDDADANSGRDVAGYNEEVDLLSHFVVECLSEMLARGHRPAALPNSAGNVARGIRKIHDKQTPPIVMVPMKAVLTTIKGLNELYRREHGYRMMVTKRKEPWRRQWLLKMSSARKSAGLKLGHWPVDSSLKWKSYFALFDTLSQTGFRKSEIFVAHTKQFDPTYHITRSNLIWRIGGILVVSPTRLQLANLTEADCAVLVPPPSKTDQFGVIWGDKPIYLPVRFNEAMCAALSLRDLELAFPCRGSQRLTIPLFQFEEGIAFTYHQLEIILHDLKDLALPVSADPSLFTYHSFRIYLCTSLGAAKVPSADIQAILRWQSPASLIIYNRMQPEDYVSLIDKANSAVITSYSTANFPMIDSDDLSLTLDEVS